MKKKNREEIDQERIYEMIAVTADATAKAVCGECLGGDVNYYHVVEKLLTNYRRLKTLLEREEEYMIAELHEKSKSVTVVSGNGSREYQSTEETEEEIAQEKMINFAATYARFREVDKVLELFRDQKEFVVVQMYYMGLDADGNEREADAPPYTWEEITAELSERGILRDEKTARRWRNNIISDIAICMFGTCAAVEISVFKEKMCKKSAVS